MKVPFVTKLLSKTPKEIPRKITCKRCLRLQRNGTAANAEHENSVKGHTCDSGCMYTSYDCFSNPDRNWGRDSEDDYLQRPRPPTEGQRQRQKKYDPSKHYREYD